MKYSIYLIALALVSACGSKEGNNLSETTRHGEFATTTQQEFTWEGDCSSCAEVSKNEWATTCSGKLIGHAEAFSLDEFTTTFRGDRRNVCKIPRYQALKLKGSKVNLAGNSPKSIGFKLSRLACSCSRPQPHHIECTPSAVLHYLDERGTQIAEQNFIGFSANKYCLGGSGSGPLEPKPCEPEKDAEVYNECITHSFGLFDALTKQVLHP